MNTPLISSSVVFEAKKDFNSTYFRIPFMAVTPKGTLIAGGDVRYIDSSDYNLIDIAIARSEDGGLTWTHKQVIHPNNQVMDHSRKMDGCILVDQITGRIFVFCLTLDVHWHLDTPSHDTKSLVYRYSDDDGITWSDEIDLKHVYDDGCSLLLQGPGNGIQLQDGTLAIPIQRWVAPGPLIRSTAGILYSKDGGDTWQLSKTNASTYSSESSIVEYKPNQILMTSRTPLTSARGFYTTSDLGDTWVSHDSDNTIYENGGCQASMIQFKAPNQKIYTLYTSPQHTGTVWDRRRLTLMASDDHTHWNMIAEVIHEYTEGYSSLVYDPTKEELYILTEQDGNLTCRNLTCYLPLIMQNTPSYNNQAISRLHRFPTYSQGHYMSVTKPECWYKLLSVTVKQNGFALLKLNVLGFEHDDCISLKIKQLSESTHDLSHCHLESSLNLSLIPTSNEDGLFTYDLYFKPKYADCLSTAIINCMLSDLGGATLSIATTFQDETLEVCTEQLPTSCEGTEALCTGIL